MSVCALLQHNQLKMKTKTKAPKKSLLNSQNGTDSKQGNLTKRLNPPKEIDSIKKFKKIGAEGSSILIGLYYKGSAELKELKGGDSPQCTYNSARRLIRKNYVNKTNEVPGRYFLTDIGRDLVSPFVKYIRENTPAY